MLFTKEAYEIIYLIHNNQLGPIALAKRLEEIYEQGRASVSKSGEPVGWGDKT